MEPIHGGHCCSSAQALLLTQCVDALRYRLGQRGLSTAWAACYANQVLLLVLLVLLCCC
jgi:hypothetical protein